MNVTPTRRVLAASFATSDGAVRAAGAVLGAFGGEVANTAVLHVKPNGTPHFVESKDWGTGRGAVVGGAIGLIGGPLGVLAGSGIGALATKLRDKGFPDEQLRRLGETLGQDDSVVIFEIATDAAEQARGILTAGVLD